MCFKCINYFNTICDGLYFRKSTKGKGSAFKGIVPVVLVSGLSFLIPEMVVSYFVGAELAGVAASVISLVCTILASMKFTNPDAIL